MYRFGQRTMTYCFCVPGACICHLSPVDKAKYTEFINEQFLLDAERRQYDDLCWTDYFRRKNTAGLGASPMEG